MNFSAWTTPTRRLYLAVGAIFVLMNIGGNFFTYATPLWLVAAFTVSVCVISAFALVFSIAWLCDGAVKRSLAIGCVALSLLSGVGAVLSFPPEMNSSAIELSAIRGADRTEHAIGIAQAAAMALEATEPEARLTYARVAYQMTGRSIRYRNETGQVTTFVPDSGLRRSIEDLKKTEAAIKAGIDDYVANGLQRQMVKSIALLTLIGSACIAVGLASRRLEGG